MDANKLKERVWQELDEMLECKEWDSKKLSCVYQLANIAHWIMEMEQMTRDNEKKVQ